MRYTPDTNRDIPRGHLIEARHRYSMELSAVVGSLMLLIQECYGKDELLRIQREAHNAMS